MNWHHIESQDQRGLVVHFTNDQPSTDFSISNECVDKYRLATHTVGNKQGEILGIVFRTLEDAKVYAEELSKTENLFDTKRLVDTLAEYVSIARLLGEREESAGLG